MKKIIAYGAGAAFRNYIKTCEELPQIMFAIDNNLETENIEGVKIYKKKYLEQFIKMNGVKDYQVIIFAMSSSIVYEISNELVIMGLRYKDDFNEYSVLIKESVKARFHESGIQLKDSDYTYVKNILKNLQIDNQSSVIGTWVMMSIVEHTRKLDGDIIELGAYKCGLSFFLTVYKNLFEDNRKYFIVDSFEGFKNYISKDDPEFLKDMFKDVSFERIEDMLKDYEDVIIERGFIPEVLTIFDRKKFSVIYYDCDTYESCKQSLEYFIPKLCTGGYFIIHDYFAKEEGATGVKKATDEFLIGYKNIDAMELAETTHLILRKV